MKDWNGLYQYMSGYLKQHLPPHLTYHHWGHTVHVLNTAEIIARAEGIPEEEILLIKTGALFHDAGYVFGPKDHEDKSIEMALGVLPQYGYTASELKLIIGLIRATAIPQQPQTLSEKVLADADLDYLGSDYYEEMADSLYREFRHYHPDITPTKWNRMQAEFLTIHHYHTDFCIRHREPHKQHVLRKIINSLPEKQNFTVHD